MEKRMITVSTGGKKYDVELTLGACREYRRISGKEISEIRGVTDIAEMLYACAVSTGRRRGRPVEVSLEEFCDGLPMDVVGPFTELLEGSGLTAAQDEAGGQASKKKN